MFSITDPHFQDLVDPNSKIELLSNGFKFTEGPVWHSEENCLYFSDIPADTIYRYDDSTGVSVFRKPSQFSNGLTLDKEGNLIACEHKSRSVTLQTEKRFAVVVNKFNEKRLNSPNDIVACRNGTIYFTDPTYGLRAGLGGPADQELDFQGVFMIKPQQNQPILLIDECKRPNGLALSNDEKSLFVIDSELQHIRLYKISDEGELRFDKIFSELWGDGPGRPDGVKLDVNGNVFCTGPGGIWVFTSFGKLLGKIRFQQKTANLAWGDEDRKSLYVTSSNFLFRLRCKTSGRSPMD